MHRKLGNYITGKWVEGKSEGKPLYDAVTGEVIALADTSGLEMGEMLAYGRRVGNPNLRSMTFHERGRMLKALALHLLSKKEAFYEVSYRTGATRADSWIDIEGGIGNLFSYASLRRQFPNEPFHVEGDTLPLSKGGSFIGQHILVPKTGVAIHINAFNFPVWGMLEKVAVNWLAGMPAVVKPATLTSYLTEVVVREIIDSGILPDGALQLICGSAGDLLDHVSDQDVVTFTGSADTGRMLKAHPRIMQEAVPFNMEADSLNCAVLGLDAEPGSPAFNLFVKEVRKEMTVKCGQKCTAIRRAIVPETYVEAVQKALAAQLDKTTIGNPRNKEVRMGALAGKTQVEEVRERIAELTAYSTIVYGNPDEVAVLDASAGDGAFLSPVVLLNEHPFEQTGSHDIEAFGPVSTLMPYKDTDEAIQLARLGKGSLCCSVTSEDPAFVCDFTLGASTHHGRILILNEECAKESTGHGSPLPGLVHGGPGRAGGGEEMGGYRGVLHYMQRTALQGSPSMMMAVTNRYHVGARQAEKDVHPFRKHFEDLEIGETLVTHRHTVTETDIVNFANVSGDNFYAHMDETSLEGTLFEGRVAHGYFILSKAAGLFVDPKKGPVLLNYGLEDCRFTKPVYPGMTIGVILTVKEKVDQEKRSEDDVAKGIVKWLVDVRDETNETVAIATILTMVKKRIQG